MAKHHKNSTRHKLKKREYYANDFYAREQKLNGLINTFVKEYKHMNPYSTSQYEKMDKKRLEIKRLLSLQGGEVWKQSYRRKRFYNKQLNRFKYYYVAWKNRTYYTYLRVRFDVPTRMIPVLALYKKVHNIYATRYML